MAKLKIRQGTKLNIAVQTNANTEFTLKSTFEKSVNEASFLISAPMKDGKHVEPDDFSKLLLKYEQGGNSYTLEGYVDDTVKVGIRTFWKIRKVSETQAFFERSDIRVNSQIEVELSKVWKTEDGEIKQLSIPALTKDISAGGLALWLNAQLLVGEIFDITLPAVGRKKAIVLMAENCWSRETEKGNLFKHMAGIKFIFSDAKERERAAEYVAAVQKQVK